MRDARMASKEVASLAPEDLLDRWRTHIAIIVDEWVFVLQNRTRYRAIQRLLARTMPAQGRTDQTRGFLEILWSTEAAMAVRRELDGQAGVINIWHLLHELEQRSEVMTRGAFMEMARITQGAGVCWCHWPEEEARANDWIGRFDFLAVEGRPEWDAVDDVLDSRMVAQDQNDLLESCGDVLDYAQRLIAHRTPMKHHWLPIRTIDAALDDLWTLIGKYYLLLSSEPLRPKKPRPMKDWNKEFRATLEAAARSREKQRP